MALFFASRWAGPRFYSLTRGERSGYYGTDDSENGGDGEDGGDGGSDGGEEGYGTGDGGSDGSAPRRAG